MIHCAGLRTSVIRVPNRQGRVRDPRAAEALFLDEKAARRGCELVVEAVFGLENEAAGAASRLRAHEMRASKSAEASWPGLYTLMSPTHLRQRRL